MSGLRSQNTHDRLPRFLGARWIASERRKQRPSDRWAYPKIMTTVRRVFRLHLTPTYLPRFATIASTRPSISWRVASQSTLRPACRLGSAVVGPLLTLRQFLG